MVWRQTFWKKEEEPKNGLTREGRIEKKEIRCAMYMCQLLMRDIIIMNCKHTSIITKRILHTIKDVEDYHALQQAPNRCDTKIFIQTFLKWSKPHLTDQSNLNRD